MKIFFGIISAMVFLTTFLMPISTNFSNIALIFFFVAIGAASLNRKLLLERKNLKILKFTTLLFITPCVVSMFVSDSPDEVFNVFGKRVTFLLTPLFFLFLKSEHLESLKQYSLKGLLLGSVGSSLFLLLNNFYSYYATRPFGSFDNELLNYYHTSFYYTNIIDIHPSYYGMFLLFSLIFLLYYLPFKNMYLNISIFIILTLSIIFLNARIILFFYIIIMGFFFKNYLQFHFKNLFKFSLLAIIITAIMFSAFYFMFKKTYSFYKLTNGILWELSYEVGTNYNDKVINDSRLARWDAAFSTIMEKPVFGYGVDKEQEVLVAKYNDMGMTNAAQQRYNAHNQFLGFAVEGGIVSMLALIVFFFFNFFYSLKAKDVIGTMFLLSVLFICLVENYLERNAGITFVAFFATLFLFSNYSKHKHIPER